MRPVDWTGQMDDRLAQLEEENLRLREHLSLLEDTRNRLGTMSERLIEINRVGQELNSLDMDKIVEIAVRKIPELIGAKYCSLFLYDYQTDDLILRSHNHPGEINPRIVIRNHRNTVMGLVLHRKSIVHLVDIDEYERENHLALERTFADKYATRTCISAPLTSGNFIVGVLNFADKVDGTFFDEVNDLPTVEQLSRILGLAVRNCRLFQSVQNQARTDGMTRLANYRAFHETLRSEIHRSTRYGRPMGLLMIDVDSFKAINDRHGHPGGDHVLTELATILHRTLRREDVPCRYGGDEIAIVLPETSPEGTLIVARRLLNLIRSHEFVFDGNRIQVTVSMGAAIFRAGQTINDIVAAADQALYAAKQGGKNRLEVAPTTAGP